MVDLATVFRTKPARKQSLARSFKTAFAGVVRTIATQRNMKIHVLCATGVLLFGVLFPTELTTRTILLFCIALVLFAEVLNTALEAIVDLYTGSYHRLAQLAKDAAAGGVLILALMSTFIFVSVLWAHYPIFYNEWPQIRNHLSIAFFLLLNEALGLFYPLPFHVATLRCFASVVALLALLPQSQDAVFWLALLFLILVMFRSRHERI